MAPPRGPYKSIEKLSPRGQASRRRAEAKAAAATAPTQPTATEAAIESEQARITRASQLRAVETLLKIRQARNGLEHFVQLMMPDPEFGGDTNHSLFVSKPHHKMLIEGVERVERGELMRSAYSIPPQHGKSTILSKYGVAWIIGRNPHKNIIVGTYGEDFANFLGAQVREVLQSDMFKKVFPKCVLKVGSQSKTEMGTTAGGSLTFVGRGTATTGHPCDLFIIDDPLKDATEAESPAIRKALKSWYASVVFSRCHVMTPILIVHTRWHEDDLIGFLCDPTHPEYNKETGAKWTYINVPAIVDTEDLAKALGVELGSALWPERFPLTHLREAKSNSPRWFSALYMGRPSPEDGDFFKAEMIVTYRDEDRPPLDELQIYAASDHAVGLKQSNDPSCFLIVGIDRNDEMWLLDCAWGRLQTDKAVEEMLRLGDKYKPLIWFAESGHISKSIGPFLYKRMRETKKYIYIAEQTPVQDKSTRAQSIRARMAMKIVHFPARAWWFEAARAELLKFPAGKHDDFVDTLAHLGLGLDLQVGGSARKSEEKPEDKVGSLAWIKAAAKRDARPKLSMAQRSL